MYTVRPFNNRKVIGFYIIENVKKSITKTISGFNSRKEAEDFAIEFGLIYAKIMPVYEES